MISALLSALNSRGVSAVLLAVGVAVAYVPRDHIDPEAIEAAAGMPLPGVPAELRGFRFPAPGDYPLRYMPWIESREDFVAYYTQGEDPDVVRRYMEGPEEELIGYLGEAFLRVTARYPEGLHRSPNGLDESRLTDGPLGLRQLPENPRRFSPPRATREDRHCRRGPG